MDREQHSGQQKYEPMFRNRKNIKFVYLTLILSLSLMGALFIFLSQPADGYERPQFKDGLASKWHSGSFCLPCHYMLLGTKNASDISKNCIKCHQYVPKNPTRNKEIDMTKIFGIHQDIVCIKCHVGPNADENLTAADFHSTMSKIPCLGCHVLKNGIYEKPPKTQCSACHSADPHVVHDNRLEKMCEACHGEFGANYSVPSPSTGAISNQSEIRSRESLSIGGQYPTIGQLISRIIESLIQITR